MKFNMGDNTLTQLANQTSTAGQDLGALVRQLAEAATPLEGKFNGAGKAKFDQFKAHVDEIANNLNASLNSVLAGIQGQAKAFTTGDQQIADQVSRLQASMNIDPTKFH